jgi:AraC-like DNA-binding protein
MSPHDAVSRAIDVVEEGLDRHLTVAEMADAAGYSLFHFCRVFARCTRLSPYTYLIRRRLTLAADDVLGSSRRMIDVGTGLGFETHDGFTRAFARLYGVTPSEARQSGDVAASRRLPRLTTAHLACLERHSGLVADPPDVATRPACGDVVHLARPVRWPESRSPIAPDDGARPVAFTVADDADLPLVLDWLHHVWVVAERFDLAGPEVRIERASTTRVRFRVVPWVAGCPGRR